MIKMITPPFEELGDMSGINISRTTTAKSWDNTRNIYQKAGKINIAKRLKDVHASKWASQDMHAYASQMKTAEDV